MAAARKEPNVVYKESLTMLVQARETVESKNYNNAKCESHIVYTGTNKAEVTFWLNGTPNKAHYELNDKGTWYCTGDWND
jgi:hypothetical protein